MPAPYTPTARRRIAAPALPNGDPKSLATWRDLLDAFAAEPQANVNRLTWSGDFSVDPGGTNAVFTVNVGAIYGVTLTDLASGFYLPYVSAAQTVGASKIEGGGNLANSSWYYVYAWSNAGSLDFEISLTGPSSSRVRKSGSADADLARVYLGCFPTDSAGNPVPLMAVRGSYRYRRSAVASVTGLFAADGLRAVAFGGGAVARTALDLSARVPPHARRAILFGQSVVTSTAAGASTSLDLYDAADTTSVAEEIVAVVANNTETARAQARAEVQLTSAQLCGYAVVGSGGLYDAAIDLMGWEE